MTSLNLHSIRFRLTSWYAGLLAATLLAAAILAWLTLAHSIRATVDKELRARLDGVRHYVEEEARGEGKTHLAEELNEDATVNAGSAYLRISDLRGAAIYISPEAKTWPAGDFSRNRSASTESIRTIYVNGNPVRILTAPVSIGVVQVGLPMEEFHEMRQDFFWSLVLGAPLLLILAVCGGYWMSGRALRPVDRIASAAKRISSANLSERLPYSGSGDELDRLSQVLNKMLSGLEAAFRQITQFTADASHELRTPLAIIRTTAELSLSRPRTLVEHERAWSAVLVQTDRTTELIEDLLTLTRADSGAGEFNLEAVALAPIVAASVSDMEIMATSKGVHLQLNCQAELELTGDAAALRRVFAILIDNALKATAPGGIVNVSVTRDYAPLDAGLVTVSDSGVGISEEHLPHIFDRFYRASADRSRATGGAGLGLAIAHWIVAAHSGTIHVRSQVGAGSSFQVVLPVRKIEAASLTQSSEAKSKLKA